MPIQFGVRSDPRGQAPHASPYTVILGAVVSATSSMRPDRSLILRSQLAASARSWVTRIKVAPRSRFKREHEVNNALTRRLVEISGRLVGDEDRRTGRQRAGEGDTLLFAAR